MFYGGEEQQQNKIALFISQQKHKQLKNITTTVSIKDLDWTLVNIARRLFLTTFEASVIFWGCWGSSKNKLEPKIKANQIKLV